MVGEDGAFGAGAKGRSGRGRGRLEIGIARGRWTEPDGG